jgi:ribosome-binding factor A
VSRRTERIGNVIRGIVARAIQARLSDPRIEPLTSVTRVEVSEDLAVARVYVSIMAPEPRQRLCLAALQHAAGRLRGLVGQQVALRLVPRLSFQLDPSIQGAFRTVQAIDQAMAELGQRPPWELADENAAAPGPPPAPDAPLESDPATASPPAEERQPEPQEGP